MPYKETCFNSKCCPIINGPSLGVRMKSQNEHRPSDDMPWVAAEYLRDTTQLVLLKKKPDTSLFLSSPLLNSP